MDAEFKGSSEHAAQHQHGVQTRQEPPAPRTVEQRVAELERRITKLEAPTEAPTE